MNIFSRIFNTVFDPREKEIRKAIRELHALNDRELDDLGLSRYGIEAAVRNGHPDTDNTRRAA
ncbi:MAG: DUF1127 domain-containing protein [Thiothrix sp.]|nr:DUF1127 domain-containing protein [Thiothrix sp.]HPQ94417.1 DUF1127 domain-containing protein [Thiolinea sp.]